MTAEPTMDDEAQLIASLEPRFEWGYFARWWDCVRDGLEIHGPDGPRSESWSYVDLYEMDDICIAVDANAAEVEFRHRYPWIADFHVHLIGPVKLPPARKAKRKAKAVPANHQTLLLL